MNTLAFPIYCKLYGVCKDDRQSALSQSRDGDHLQVVVTDESVFVYSIPLNAVLGELREDLSTKLRSENMLCLDAIIDRCTGGTDGQRFGCNIRIYPTSNMLRGKENFSHLHGE